uniref:Peroxisomal adenine nucleotide carrier 1-like isoform X2 n=1 Tax=Rhizophora mucronata TaxID=61149 RepID=A0A2P2IWN2_RHIMU
MLNYQLLHLQENCSTTGHSMVEHGAILRENHACNSHCNQTLFILGRVRKRYLLSASIKTHVVFVIFSLIIRSIAELSTVFKIWAFSPLKKPSVPSLLQIA